MTRRPAFVSTAGEPARVCPACQRRQDAATTIALDGPGARPLAAGDVGVCAYCAAVLVVEAAGGFRLATSAEYAALDPDLQAVLRDYRPPAWVIGKAPRGGGDPAGE
jgi:hypothetical protein